MATTTTIPDAIVEKARSKFLESAPGYNAELRPDGSEEPGMAAYVEGWHDAYEALPDAIAAALNAAADALPESTPPLGGPLAISPAVHARVQEWLRAQAGGAA
jgi:hypothetical protein